MFTWNHEGVQSIHLFYQERQMCNKLSIPWIFYQLGIATTFPFIIFPNPLWHALVTRYLNKMKRIVTIFLSWSLSDSVAKWIMHQTFDQEDCGSNSPGGVCIYTNQKKLGLAGICTRIICVEARCPNHITNVSEFKPKNLMPIDSWTVHFRRSSASQKNTGLLICVQKSVF